MRMTSALCCNSCKAATILPAQEAALCRAALLPALVCLEGAANSGDAGSGTTGGGATSEERSAAAARRAACCGALRVWASTQLRIEPVRPSTMRFKHVLSIIAGTVAGWTMGEAMDKVTSVGFTTRLLPARESQSAGLRRGLRAPCNVVFLNDLASNPHPENANKRVVEPWVPSNPFLGPKYWSRCCMSCGHLPEDVFDKPFQLCSLCKDPAVGRFCCKEPCFAAFWRGGHMNTCAGRDKMKKRKNKVQVQGG
jgi:hypothetical protein